MYIVSSFEQTIELEMAIAKVEKLGVPVSNIFAIPLDKNSNREQFIDTIHDADSGSVIDLPAILATLLMLFGAIYGFILKWGPIIWGLIGFLLGASIGLLIKLFITKDKIKLKNVKTTEVFLLINCSPEQEKSIENILWQHYALGVAKFDK